MRRIRGSAVPGPKVDGKATVRYRLPKSRLATWSTTPAIPPTIDGGGPVTMIAFATFSVFRVVTGSTCLNAHPILASGRAVRF
jgi:hypothetical protein